MLSIAERYRWHAETEFRDASDIYYEWANRIAEDDEVLALIERLPDVKRRAPLLFAAMRFRGAPHGSYDELRPWLLRSWPEVETVALARSQQTNEAARCATLLPIISAIEGPIALLEIGASAGACLFPDRYEYEYVTPEGTGTGLVPSDGPSPVRLRCRINSSAYIPSQLPRVVWRAGIDLNPLSFADSDDLEWLRTLVWPEHDERRKRLDDVARLIRPNPPRIDQGDALDLLPQLLHDAPDDATVVIFHTAVLAYFSAEQREHFVATVRPLPATWVSNEGPGVLPSVAAQVDPSIEIGSRFVLARDGEPVALTGGHGQTYHGL